MLTNFPLFLHSLIRWLVLISLIISLLRAYKGYKLNLAFTKTDNSFRHWTATFSHVQLVIGIILYSQSPITKYFWKNINISIHQIQLLFFGVIHISLMIIAITIITIGSSLAKRKTTNSDKFKTILIWFSIALLIIFIAIPWPFSPFANRPFIR